MLTFFRAVVIGLLQGVTELFPVSSLGHAVLIPAVVGGSWAQDLDVSSPESPFLAFVVGGWSACMIGGFRRSERAILHGGIVWTVAIPILLIVTALGAGVYFGGWYGGLVGTPAWVVGPKEIDPNAAIIARNSALGSLTALLLGLVGATIGSWMGSGQPMRISFRRSKLTEDERVSRAKVRSVS